MKKAVLAFAILWFLGGCTWVTEYLGGEDNAEPPRPLLEVKQALPVETLWSHGTGEGSGEQMLGLRPAVYEGHVYVASRKGRVSKYELKKGRLVWEVETGREISAGPAVGGGKVFVGTRNAEVLALNLPDGKSAWTARVTTEVLATPAVGQDVLVVRSIDGKLHGINQADGKVLWNYAQQEPVLTLRGTSKPLVVGNTVLAGFDNGEMTAIGIYQGQVAWERKIAVAQGRTELERIVDVDADPAVQDGVIYVTSYQGNVGALALVDGSGLWSRKMSSYAGLTVTGDRLYITDDTSQVWAMLSRNGASLWKQDELQWRFLTAPVSMGGYVVVGDFEGYLHWLSPEDGRIVARARAGSNGFAVAPVVEGDILVCLDRGGELTALRLRPRKAS